MICTANLARCRAYFTLLMLLPVPVFAAPSEPAPLIKPSVSLSEQALNAGNLQLTHQQEQQLALEQHLTFNAPAVRLSPPSDSFGRIIFPQETPCFTLLRATLSGTDSLLHWLPLQHINNQAHRDSAVKTAGLHQRSGDVRLQY